MHPANNPPSTRIEAPGAMPETLWSKHRALQTATPSEQRSILDILISRYWKPVYCYLRRTGWSEEDSKDLVQDFFVKCIEWDLFVKADPSKRFRNLLLTALKRFHLNAHRDTKAQKRRPSGGIDSLDDTEFQEENQAALRAKDTADEIFDREWRIAIFKRAAKRLPAKCHEAGKDVHYELFYRYRLVPVLEAGKPPKLQELADDFGLTEKEVSNRAKGVESIFLSILKEEIRLYSGSEAEIDDELRDLKQSLASWIGASSE